MRACLLAVLLLLGCSDAPHPGAAEPGTAEPGTAEPARDRSLSAGQYRARGLPRLGSWWTPAERDAARGVLRAIAAEDPALLPRLGSPRSGAVFAKLLREEFESPALDGLGDVGAAALSDEAIGARVAQRSFFWVYRIQPRQGRGRRFDRELVEIGGAELARALDRVQALRTLRARLPALAQSETANPFRHEDWERELIHTHFSRLAELCMSRTLRADARRAGLLRLEQLLERAALLLPADAAFELRDLLSRARRGLPHGGLAALP